MLDKHLYRCYDFNRITYGCIDEMPGMCETLRDPTKIKEGSFETSSEADGRTSWLLSCRGREQDGGFEGYGRQHHAEKRQDREVNSDGRG